MSEQKVILDRRESRVALVVINSPERRNAIDMQVRDELYHNLELAEQDENIRALVLTGAGEHFCAGGDIKDWRDFTAAEAKERLRRIHKPIGKIVNMEKPVIAMIRGYAVGAGMNFALACDMVMAAENAKFAQTFMRVGLIPDAGGMCFLPLAVGLHKAKELIFTADFIDAHEALRLGVVNRVVPDEQLEEETLALARKIANGPPIAMGLTKRVINTTFLNSIERVLEYEAQGQSLCFLTKDHQEGKNAFLEKRNPEYTGE